MVRELDADRFAVTTVCRVLEVSTSGFSEWQSRPPSARNVNDAHLLDQSIDIHAAAPTGWAGSLSPTGSRNGYGSSTAAPTSTPPGQCWRSCSTTANGPQCQPSSKLGRTLQRWFDKIVNFHIARVSNGPTEALNNLIKRIKRIGFGFRNYRNYRNYRIRALLYAGKPNWRVLGSIIVQ